jgi:phage shock protein A
MQSTTLPPARFGRADSSSNTAQDKLRRYEQQLAELNDRLAKLQATHAELRQRLEKFEEINSSLAAQRARSEQAAPPSHRTFRAS